MTQRIMAFIDGYGTQNAANAIGLQIDYKKLLDYLEGDDMLVRANYYACVPQDTEQFFPMMKMLDWLVYNGYNVVKKKIRQYESDGVVKVKQSIAVEMTADVLEAAKHVDCIVLFTGDGDYRYLIERVQRTSAAYVVVFADRDTASDELRRQADKFVDLKDIKAVIEKPQPKPEESAEAA